jgi:branched-chain amino acid transport system ATP-binding protein
VSVETEQLLAIDDIEAAYSQAILALRGVTLSVPRGGFVALLGSNGAGKTTTLRAVSGLLAAERGEVTRGAIRYDGVDITTVTPADLVRRGLVQVLEGRHCFSQLTIEENLVTGALAHGFGRAAIRDNLDRIYHYFPRLKEKRRLRAGYASGGEQQMAAIGRALMARPRLLVLDEPSMGLAPLLVEEIFAIIDRLNRDEGLSVLVAEQNAVVALRYVHAAYIIENGRVALSGTSAELAARDDVKEFYFGLTEGGGRYRDWMPPPPRSWLYGP